MKLKIIKKIKRSFGSKKRARATGRKVATSPLTGIAGIGALGAAGGYVVGKGKGAKKMADKAASQVVLLSIATEAKKRGYKLGKLTPKQLTTSTIAAKKRHNYLTKKDVTSFHSQFKKK